LVLLLVATLLIFGHSTATAQTAGAAVANPPVGSMSDVMVSMIYAPTNNILLSLYRGEPQDEKEWVALQRNAVLLAESANVLMRPGYARDQGDWARDAKMLADAGAALYKAAQIKDPKALAGLDQQLNATCTTCHKQYRTNIAGARERLGPSRLPAQ
jgi:hypothetical protein